MNLLLNNFTVLNSKTTDDYINWDLYNIHYMENLTRNNILALNGFIKFKIVTHTSNF